MNQTSTCDPIPASVSSAGERNRVLRNTYWLLALSMAPTVLGAWIGVTTGIARTLSPGIGIIVFLVGAFSFMFAIERAKNSAAGFPMLLAFAFFMGLMLSRLVGAVLGLADGASLIVTVFAGTGAIFLGMAWPRCRRSTSAIFPRWAIFSSSAQSRFWWSAWPAAETNE